MSMALIALALFLEILISICIDFIVFEFAFLNVMIFLDFQHLFLIFFKELKQYQKLHKGVFLLCPRR